MTERSSVQATARATAVAAIALAPAGASVASPRAVAGWLSELDGCLLHMETGGGDLFATGRSDAFADWYIAHPQGGVCNADPAPCLTGGTVTLINPDANGAATLRASDPLHDGQLTCAHTPNPPHHRAAESADPTRDWIAKQVADGRLRAEAASDGVWRGCREDGSAFSFRLNLDHPLGPRFVFVAEPDRHCQAQVS